MPSDNSLLMWSIFDECNRTNSFVVSLKFEFHLMGVHTFANIHEVLALADVLGSQLCCASSAVSIFLHHATSPPKMKPPIMTIAITAAKPTMVSTTSP